jgi:phage terminase large subunit
LADIDVLEGLKSQDESYYRIYTLGLYAKLKGMIHEIIELNEFPTLESPITIYGLDFGFANPSVLLKLEIDIKLMAIYITELIYESGLTNTDLIDRMKAVVPIEDRQDEFYADSAEPARIEEIYQAEFNCLPSDKGKKSVWNGIDFLNRFTIYSLKDNVQTNSDFRSYKRKVDKNGHVLEDPVKYNDHAPNAARYAAYTHLWERMIDMVPGWVWHRGMQKDEDKAEKEAEQGKSDQQGKIEAVRAPVDIDIAATKGKGIGKNKGKEEKKDKPKRESDDDSWVI